MKLGIGIVTSAGYDHQLPTPFFWSMWALHSKLPEGNVLIRSGKFPTDCARNEICREAIKANVDRLLFLDCDHAFEPEAITRLLAHDVDIVTARYHVKKPPYHPNLYLTPREPHTKGDYRTVHYGQGLFKVDRCGAGALLIKRHVLQVMGDPWFRYARDPRPPHDLSVSEDFYFCERAQQLKFDIWADWDAELRHLVSGEVDGQWHTNQLQLVEHDIGNGRGDLAEKLVVCGYPDGYTLPSGHHVEPYDQRDPVG